jgi:hypothetical protein
LAAEAAFARLELKKREGSLIPREAAERFIFERAREERDALIAWVARVSPALAHELGCEAAAPNVAKLQIRAHMARSPKCSRTKRSRAANTACGSRDKNEWTWNKLMLVDVREYYSNFTLHC